MEQPEDSCAEILDRLRPALKAVFAARGVSEPQARKILRESCAALVTKRRKPPNPDGWLFQTVVEKCRRLKEEEAALEDAPE
ncbi:MAG TPA: hypothetical protein VLT87_01120 [Thermoanaerobaculia bacterium]|nr:hypothetical protein [Thermoanaerobaculia bacterium]